MEFYFSLRAHSPPSLSLSTPHTKAGLAFFLSYQDFRRPLLFVLHNLHTMHRLVAPQPKKFSAIVPLLSPQIQAQSREETEEGPFAFGDLEAFTELQQIFGCPGGFHTPKPRVEDVEEFIDDYYSCSMANNNNNEEDLFEESCWIEEEKERNDFEFPSLSSSPSSSPHFAMEKELPPRARNPVILNTPFRVEEQEIYCENSLDAFFSQHLPLHVRLIQENVGKILGKPYTDNSPRLVRHRNRSLSASFVMA